MLSSTRQTLEVVAAGRGSAILVTTMTASKVWPTAFPDSLFDVHFLPSAMGHAGDIALGLALGCPERRVICVNGDGSLAMNLGSLLTAVDSGVKNLTMILLVNGIYRIVGPSPVPARKVVDWCALARGAGWQLSIPCDSARDLEDAFPALLAHSGPSFASVLVEDASELEQRLPVRHPGVALRDLRLALRDTTSARSVH